MRVCLISVEIFAWGKHGGFGKATRTIGRELATRGHEVFAVVPRRSGQKPVETLDGINVLGFPPAFPLAAARLFRECDADIYHSCEPSLGTWLAMKTMPDRKHVVTFRDPRDLRDWRMEFRHPSLNRFQVVHNYLYENNPLVRRCIRNVDAVYATAHSLVPKIRSMYGLARDPEFLPTPVAIPEAVRKAETATVCYVARLDRRKRPELFLDLAVKFPHVRFIAAGKSRDRGWEAFLRKRSEGLPNLEMTGFVDPFRSDLHSKILGKSWIFVNTATREALPNSFLEAAAHRCAILSAVDADGFASRFGYHAKEDDFAEGLASLLGNDGWRERGEKGYAYVRETFGIGRAIDLHLAAYARVLGDRL